MKNNETGEFELVMGNRQLLSGFFIVCLLFGVAFAMGYIVGRNSSPSARAVSEMQTPSQAPIVSDTRPAPGGAPVQPAAPAPVEEVKAGTGGAAEPTTQPEQPPAPLAGAPAAAPAASPKTAAESAPAAGELGSGSFWQVVAIKQQD